MPTDPTSLRFGPYRLHPVQGLTEGDREVRVTPKSLAVLYVLARRSGEIVTKEELFQTVWPARPVTDAALSSCIRELRRALGDDARKPQYIETMHRRGFRFLPRCGAAASDEAAPSSDQASANGRERELDALVAQLERARGGRCRVAAISGVAGAGKATLVDELTARAARDAAWHVSRVAADPVAGRGDPYRPLLDALTALCLQPGGARVVSALQQHAPTWLAELVSVLEPGELEAQRHRTSGVNTWRFHRELDAALEAIAGERPLLLVLEELQWSDDATLDWLGGLPARLAAPILVLVTCDAEARIEVEATIALEPDTAPRVATNGREDPLARLGDEARQVLEAAAVVGARFDGADVAAALDFPPDDVDAVLADQVAAGVLRGESGGRRRTDQTAAGVHRFADPTLRARLLEGLPVQRSRKLHRRIARRIEASPDASAADRSPELAARYDRACDIERTVGSSHDAALVCRRRGARVIAHAHLRRALTLLSGMPASAERDGWDALLHTAAGGELVAAQGFGSPDIDKCFQRALALTEGMSPGERLYDILWRVWVYYLIRGPLAKAHEIARRLFEVARALDSQALELSAHHAFWCTALMLGDLEGVRRHTREAMSLCGGGLDGVVAVTRGCTLHDEHISNHHAAVCAGLFGAWAESVAGNWEDAKRGLDAAITHARDFDHPFSLAITLANAAGALAAGGDAGNARRYACEATAISTEHGFVVIQAWSGIYEGWAMARLGDAREGLNRMREALAVFRDTPLWLFRPYQLALAAELELENGEHDAAATSLEEAFAIAGSVGDRLAAARLHWLRGELALATGATDEHLAAAGHDLRAAVDIATATGAEPVRSRAMKSLERIDRAGAGRSADPSDRVRAVTDLANRRRGDT